ncbi:MULTISPECIES: hypothetical protein [unclassified Sinorhizobium]|uniref:hypothetical protein n=1 Tax=unclassified Sinorhizobium TaxID=2613772 RepID=UPI0035245A47
MLLSMRRPLRITTGYLCACAVTGIILGAIVTARVPGNTLREILPVFLATAIFMTRIVAIASLIPSAVAIAIFEWRSERRWGPYAIFGALLSAAVSIVISVIPSQPGLLPSAAIVCGSALLGLLAATIYWGIAGRFSGKIRSAP